MMPMAYPTRRAATPVKLASETLEASKPQVGSVPAMPDSTPHTPLALTAPCTSR